MGEFLDAVKLEQSKKPNNNKIDLKLREFLGDKGWKDLETACRDNSITVAVIHRVLKNKGFPVSYTAISRLRSEVTAS